LPPGLRETEGDGINQKGFGKHSVKGITLCSIAATMNTERQFVQPRFLSSQSPAP
jgi:hypothetical protein